MELGGNAPFIVFDDADLDALMRILKVDQPVRDLTKMSNVHPSLQRGRQPQSRPVTPVTPVGAAARDIFFAAKTDTSFTAVAGSDVDFDLVNKTHDER